MSGEDVWRSPEFKQWAEDVEEDMLPKMESSIMVTCMYHGKADVKFAVEMGFALLLDKPIILVVSPGTQVPDKLVQIADRIIEQDENDTDGPRKIASALVEILEELEAKE